MRGYTYSPCVISNRYLVYKLRCAETDRRTVCSLPGPTILQSLQKTSGKQLFRRRTAQHLPGIFTNRIIFTRYHHVYFCIPVQIGLLFLSLHVVSSVCHRTVKNDALNDALHSITSCLKLRYPWPDTTPLSKRWSTPVNAPSRTSFETPYSSTGILTRLFFCSLFLYSC